MDDSRGVVVVVFMCVFLFSTHEIHSVKETGTFSTKDIVIEVNNTYHDDVYDCVDFYKQPAFDHPLLVNHTFHYEMRPSSTPKLMIPNMKRSQNVDVQFKAINCPIGTVPIRRITVEDRIRERFLVKKYESRYNVHSRDTPGIHYATIKTRWSSTQKYNGGGAKISTWSPHTYNFQQYSSGQIVVRNDRDNVQVGWTVNPILYGDKSVRLFIYTSAGATQCFNTHCPGFVIVNKDQPVDARLPWTIYGDDIYSMQYMIHKDAKDGNWWLSLGENIVGFWPQNIFTNLADMATSIEWGGQVYSQPDEPSPPMGSGSFISDNVHYDAYCAFVSTINEAHQVVDALNVDTYADSSRYEVKYIGTSWKAMRNLVLFGGPGGATENKY